MTAQRDKDARLAPDLVAWSRKIVGRSMANHLRAELVLDAMEAAVGRCHSKDVIHHSEQGSEYRSMAFGKRCREAGVRPSMRAVDDASDNAMVESFFSTLEAELEVSANLRRHRTICGAFMELSSSLSRIVLMVASCNSSRQAVGHAGSSVDRQRHIRANGC